MQKKILIIFRKKKPIERKQLSAFSGDFEPSEAILLFWQRKREGNGKRRENVYAFNKRIQEIKTLLLKA
jgi:hypothetical protein